jgi:O-antigen/teichoic acid export membrane protein
MKELLKWQLVSFVSRGLAMSIGVVQSVVIVRILSVAEYGIVTLAASIGGAFGIYQHLGLASGSTREISSADDDTEIFKIFITAVVIRYFVTVPLAIILFVLSKYLAITQYANEALVIPLKIFSLVLLIQGVQSIFNSVIAGTQRFKQLFVYQVVIAAVGLLIYIPLIYLYRVDGYFIALALFNLVGSISLGILALRPLRGKIKFPKRADFIRLLKDILSISLGIYIVKILYTYWQKSGPLLLGLSFSAEEIGLFGFALLYAAKLMAVSDAITDVNLPVLSRKYVRNVEEFKELFVGNFNKIFAFIIFAAMSAIYWVQDIFHFLVGSNKYDGSFPFIMPLVLAFVFYSVVNIVKSSILIPAKLVKEMIIGFIVLLATTVGFYFVISPSMGGLLAMAYAMAFGSLAALLFVSAFAWFKLKFSFITFGHLFLFFIGVVMSLKVYPVISVGKVLVYLMGVFVYVISLLSLKIVTREQLAYVTRKVLKK